MLMRCLFDIDSIEPSVNLNDKLELSEFEFTLDCDCPPMVGDIVVHFFENSKIKIKGKVVGRWFYTRERYRYSKGSEDKPMLEILMRVFEIYRFGD